MSTPSPVSNTAAPNASPASLLLIIGFCMILILPFLDERFSIDPSEELNENRALAAKPEFHLNKKSLNTYPERYDEWYRDHFGFRDTLISAHYGVRVSVLGLQPKGLDVSRFTDVEDGDIPWPDAMLGQDGWMFFTQGHLMSWYRGVDGMFSDNMIQNMWPKGLESESDLLFERYGSQLLYVAIPEKQSVYPEYMPPEIKRVRTRHNLDALADYFEENPTPHLLILKQPLIDAKSDKQFLYHKTDSHWNDSGAWIGYTNIMEKIRVWYPDLEPLSEDDFSKVESTIEGDLTIMLGLIAKTNEPVIEFEPTFEDRTMKIEPDPEKVFISDSQYPPLIFEIDDPDLPTAVIFGDSFTNALMPFLKHHFSRVIFYRDTPYHREIMEIEKPDIVLRIMVERNAGRTVPGLDGYFDVLGQDAAAK